MENKKEVMFYRVLVTDCIPEYYCMKCEQFLSFDFENLEDAVELLETMVVKYGKDAAIIKIHIE